MKCIIQIPCFNEEEHLPETLSSLPREIEGMDKVEWLVINDGSTDRTLEVAREHGVDHIVNFPRNRGLARAFRAGLLRALELGADVVVNTDADNQYSSDSIPDLVRPIIEKNADVVIGDRGIWSHPEFGFFKKCFQSLGSRIVSHFANASVPDVTSGFRAYSREAALHLHVLSEYTYTHETIIQAGLHALPVISVPIRINPKTRESRLFGSIWSYMGRSAVTIIRIYTFYKPLKVFCVMALIPLTGGVIIAGRFIFYYFLGDGSGKIQSLIFAAILFNLSFILVVLGILGDVMGFNRRLIEEVLLQQKKNTFEKSEAG